jgi:hypothetical protein
VPCKSQIEVFDLNSEKGRWGEIDKPQPMADPVALPIVSTSERECTDADSNTFFFASSGTVGRMKKAISETGDLIAVSAAEGLTMWIYTALI